MVEQLDFSLKDLTCKLAALENRLAYDSHCVASVDK